MRSQRDSTNWINCLYFIFFPANCSSGVEENRIQKINVFLDIVKRVINSNSLRNLSLGPLIQMEI